MGHMPTADSRTELAAFLRSRRERVRPEEVGLPEGGRRRTPGLRREEVAQLARVGVTWYTWLEQGRPINASAAVLEAIARALRLDGGETEHLFTLAGTTPRTPPDTAARIDPTTRHVLQALDPLPACVIDTRLDILAQNRGSELIFGSTRGLPPSRRNNLWLAYTEPHWRSLLADWDQEAAHLMALYRSAMAEHLGEPSWQAMVDELRDLSAEFRAGWAEHRVAVPGSRTKLFQHPIAGVLRFRTATQWLQPRAGLRMTVYCPVDAATERAIGRLSRSATKPFDDWSDTARYGSAARLPAARAG
jgi:transcriptional regulator with XRE-family HTH domain